MEIIGGVTAGSFWTIGLQDRWERGSDHGNRGKWVFSPDCRADSNGEK